MESVKVTTVTCPLCRACHNVPQGGVRAFLTDYTVVQEQEKRQWCHTFALMRNKCGECEQDGATVSFCEDCESFLCQYCAGAHKRMKVFSAHRLSTLSSSTEPTDILACLPLKRKPITCTVHPENPTSFYCTTCSQLICNECVAVSNVDSSKTVTVHQSHVLYTLTDESLGTLSAKLNKLVTSMSSEIQESQEKLDLIEKVEGHMSSHHVQLKKALIDGVKQYIEDIKAQCKCDLKQMDEKYAAREEEYKAKKSALKGKVAKVKMKRQFATKALDCTGRVPKIAMVAQAVSQVERSVNVEPLASARRPFGLTAVNLEEFPPPPLVVRDVAADLKKEGVFRPLRGRDFLYRVENTSEANESTSPFVNLFNISHFPGSWMLPGKKAKLKLRSKPQLAIKASVQPVGIPEFRVKYGRSERTLKISVQGQQSGRWLLEFTPCCLGTHRIEICVYDYWITSDVPEFIVEGELKTGDIVRRTPCSTSSVQEFVKSKGEDIKNASQYEEGKLQVLSESTSRSRSSTLYNFEVTWGHNSEKPLVENMIFRSFYDESDIPLELVL